jgi:hypothetical protein
MGPKLLIAILVLALSGANSDLASMCAAYCMSSASLHQSHHHHMESQQGPTSASHHLHSYRRAANCAECPPDSANSLNEKADCASLAEIQALKQGSFSFDSPRGVAHLHVGVPARALALASDGERFSPVNAPNKIRSFNPVSAPLRI